MKDHYKVVSISLDIFQGWINSLWREGWKFISVLDIKNGDIICLLEEKK
jgi:hypothetical protein